MKGCTRRLYTALYIALIPWLYARLWLKGRRSPAYRLRISERFGRYAPAVKPVEIWLHAVSVGEVHAAAPLIRCLLEHQHTVLVTTMTPTGSARVEALFGNSVQHVYVPYELPWALNAFFRTFQPRAGIIIETELWPNLISHAHAAHVKLLLFNARLSERSYRRYRWIRSFLQALLSCFTTIQAQTEADAERFQHLGAPRVAVGGNIKCDVRKPDVLAPAPTQFAARLRKRLLVIAGSTHEGEESALLSAFQTFLGDHPHACLLIAPRHPERFAAVYALSQHYGFKTGLRSRLEHDAEEDMHVLILDVLGELLHWYAVCDYAFVGGSLVPVGGHNVLEPMVVETPAVTGPFFHNAQSLMEDLLAQHAVVSVASAEAFFTQVQQWQHDPAAAALLVQNALGFLKQHQGVCAHYYQIVRTLL